MKALKNHKLTIFATLALLVASAPAIAQDADRALVDKLSKNMDEMYRSSASRGTMSMEIITPRFTRKMTMEMTTKGMDDTLIRIKTPKKERGTSTLKKGNEMWNYIPKIKKVIRVPSSMMMGSWMGSDLSNDDLVRGSSYQDDYTVTVAKSGAKAGEVCLEYTPKPKAPVTWSKILSCFDREKSLPVRQSFYDEKGKEVRQMLFSKVKVMDGREIPTQMTLVPLSEEKKGHKTIMTFVEMDFDAKVKDSEFSMSNLRRGR